VQKRRHFKADEFVSLLKQSVKEIDDTYLKGNKLYYYTHTLCERSGYQDGFGRLPR